MLGWKEVARAFVHPRVITMLFFGFSAGIPILMIFSSLSIWLREAGVQRSAVTFFSWAALGYSFKFVWAPLIDKLPLPVLTKRMGRRRAWILTSQFSIIAAILLMASTDPAAGASQLTIMALAAVMLGFSSATQDIVIDAYRIESAGSELQALMASTYIAGYRVAMIVSGAGALFLADLFGSTKAEYSYSAWQMAYGIMATTMIVGIVTTLAISEPQENRQIASAYPTKDYAGFLGLFLVCVLSFIVVFVTSVNVTQELRNILTKLFSNRHLAGFMVESGRLATGLMVATVVAKLLMLTGWINKKMVNDAYLEPLRDFFRRYGLNLAILLLALVGVYRISDIVLGVISNVFYHDLGYSKTQIAGVVITFGMVMTIVGGFVGGALAMRYGVIRILFLGAVLAAATNLLFILLAQLEGHLILLYVVISVDNLSAGLASAAFVAFLSSLTDIRFTATQYAIFSSLMTLFPKILGGYSGTIVDNVGYPTYFLITALIGVPVLLLIWLAGRRLS